MKRRIKQRKGLLNWFTILLVIIIGYFAVILVKQQIYERLVKEKDDLNRLDYIEKIAREELGMTRRGELPYSSGKSVGSR